MTPEINTFKAVVRSLMPFIESGVAGLIASLGFHATASVAAGIVAAGGTVLSIILHAAETKWAWVGAFLGSIGAPVYPPSTKKSKDARISDLETELVQLKAAIDEAKQPSTPTSTAVPA